MMNAPRLVVISPEGDDPREALLLPALFEAGLERYHVRKPHATAAELARWIAAVPVVHRPGLVLHQHHELVDECGLGGRQWRDDAGAPVAPRVDGHVCSRSAHAAATVQRALGRYDAVLFAPVFRSHSKPGHAPADGRELQVVRRLLAGRTSAERRTAVYALGGIDATNAGDALAAGFDGVAVLGAVWQATDPVRAFEELQSAIVCHAA